jgi:methionyl-tRNA synthetase
MKKFYITTPIYYPNARLHAGHAYTTLACDALARYKRQCGFDVAFLTGTDEHGEKLERAAAAAGMTPQAFVAEKRREIQDLWKLLEIENTHFIYTDRPDHTASVHRLLRLAREREPEVIYKSRYEGRYCIFDERYLSEGTEPVDCDICGRPGELISEDNYFFKLSAFQDRLLKHYEEHPDFVVPDFRFNEVKSFVRSGLRDISISRRRIKWGIPWPDDPEHVFYVWYDALTSYMTGIGYGKAEGGDETFRKFWPADVHMIGKDIIRFHAVYWPAFLMAAGEPLPEQIVAHGWLLVGQDKMSKSKGNAVYVEPVAKFFKAETNGVVSGSDVLRYYVLREFIFGQDGSISYERMLERYNTDLANNLGNLASRTLSMLHRYFGGEIPEPIAEWNILTGLLRDEQGAAARSELVPQEAADFIRESRTFRIVGESEILRESFIDKWERYDFFYALANMFGVPIEAERKKLPEEALKYFSDDKAEPFLAWVNKYLSDNAPWRLADQDLKHNRKRIATVLCTAAEALRFAAVLLSPVIPRAAQRLWDQLGCEGDVRDQDPAQLRWGGLKPGTKIGKPEIIFPRLDVAKSVEKLLALEVGDQAVAPVYDRRSAEESSKKGTTVENQPEQKPEAAPESPDRPRRRIAYSPELPSPESRTPSPESRTPSPAPQAAPSADQKITIEDFAKVEMRVGEVVAAERIPKADKLLKIQVDIGTEVRQVLAGIAQYYEPEKLVGMKVVVVTNLQPRKMRGLESNGMIVAASVGEEGKPVLATFKEEVPKGSKLR